MHPVREFRVNLSGAVPSQLDWRISRLEVESCGLHLESPFPDDHPYWSNREAYILPTLDLVISRFDPTGRSDRVPPLFYIDMASVQPGPESWVMRDLYLDVVMEADGTPKLIDSDEYAEAVLEGHLTPDEQRRALLSAERVVNGLFTHNNDLAAWLASLNIHLKWWTV
jgi:uncharacterized protein